MIPGAAPGRVSLKDPSAPWRARGSFIASAQDDTGPRAPYFQATMDILLLGPPGAGKGTQGALLAERLGLPKFATGDLLRDAVKRGTPVGLRAKAVMEAGQLVSDDIIMGVVREELGKPEARNGVIFDGVVRTVPQAEGVTALLGELGRKMDHILFFDVPDREILARLERRRGLEGRVDDDPAAVATRLQAYRAQTAPVLDWYRSRGGVHVIQAVGEVAAIAATVRGIIGR